VKNVEDLTKGHVQQFRKWWNNLRRTKFARNWRGGFYCLEVTNEGRGWHLHLHALIDARWIDELELSDQWHHATNGMGRIVKVKDARGTNFLKEVAKYVVKGNQLAAWSPSVVARFVDAFDGVRTFAVFGDLFGKRTQFAEWFKAVRDLKPRCTCGCSEMRYYSEADWVVADLIPSDSHAPARPPPIIHHAELPLDVARNWTP
jgi:hypothetical protein